MLIFLVSILPNISVAQDIHFSQYFNSPMSLGPGSIGAFDGDHRVHGIFRQQWRSVTIPYRTFGIGGDGRPFDRIKRLALGAWLFNDRAGDSRLQRSHFSIGASWTSAIGTKKPGSLTIGTRFGITSLSLDPNALTFDEQYNGLYYDPSIATSEDFTRDAMTYPDLDAGIVYRYRPEHRKSIEVGFGLFNITRPSIGFLYSDPVPLDLRSSAHLLVQFPIASRFDLLPKMQYMEQGTFNEFDLGMDLRHILLDRYGLLRAVQLGLHYRASDAGFIHAGVEYDDWTMGISYDLNFSDLVPASRNRGAIELTLIRIFKQRSSVPVRFPACPDQL